MGVGAQFHEFQPEVFSAESHAERKQRGKIEDENTRSVFHLRGIETSKEDPMLYTAYGVRELHRMDGDREVIETTVNQYRIRLADQNRSAENPSGLLVGEYSEKQIDGEKKAALLAADSEGYRMLRQQP